MLKYIQSFCDNIELPNDGYVCAIDKSGKLIAYPDFDPGYEESLIDVPISDISGGNKKTFRDISAEFLKD